MSTVIPTTSHWGAHSVRVVDDEIVEVRPASHRSRSVAVARRRRRRGTSSHAHPAPGDPARMAGERARARATTAAATSSSRSSWDEAIEAVATELDRVRTHARQREHLRRLVRMGQRRDLPSRADAAAADAQPHRRLHALDQLVQQRHVRRHPAARRRQRRRGAAPADVVADDRRAHRSRRGVRWHPGQERVRDATAG